MPDLITIQQTPGAVTTDHDPIERWDKAVSRYLETRRSENTARIYGRTLTEYKKFALESGLSPWAGDCLISYNRHVNGNGEWADDTKTAKLGHVQAFMGWAHGYGASLLTPTMVADLIDKPGTKELSPRDLLTIEEMEAILGAVEDLVTRAAIRVMANAGLRVSEACGIRSEHVYDFEGRWYVFVPKELAKSRRERAIPVPDDLAGELLALEVAPDLPLIRLHPSTIWRRVQKVVQAAGIEKQVSPHTFRHTCANRWRLMGVALEVVGLWLGHRSLDTTTRYTRPSTLALATETPAMPWDRESERVFDHD